MSDLWVDFTSNLTALPGWTFLGVAGLVLVVILILKIINEVRWMGGVEFMSKGFWALGVLGAVALGAAGFFLCQPYEEPVPPASAMAIVVGNTQNTPKAELPSSVEAQLTKMMLSHPNASTDELADLISFVEADGEPYTVELDASKLKKISNNATQAKTDAARNIAAINKQLANIQPKTSGANYLEAILLAQDEVSDSESEEDEVESTETSGKPTIVVIGSGLSDTGSLNFVGTNLLTDPKVAEPMITKIAEEQEKYLRGSRAMFYGLGYTRKPQEALKSNQRIAVRNIYKDLVKKLGGGMAKIDTESPSESIQPVDTNYTVNPVDTGCGNIELTFDDSKLKFNGDETSFVSQGDAEATMNQIVEIYNQNKGNIKSIIIDGYIAHYQSKHANLAGDRANVVRNYLVGHGVPADKISANGKGYGPFGYNDQESHDATDSRNRMIKVTFERDKQECRE